MKKTIFSLLLVLACGISSGAGVTLPSCDDPKYTRDWYAPPPDWVPAVQPRGFNANTRIPEIVWVEYEGSYGPGLQIQPIAREMLELLRSKGICAPSEEKSVPDCQLDRKNTADRTVEIRNLKIPVEWSSSFTNLSFKVRSEVAGAGADLEVEVKGLGVFKTADCKDVRKEGDVTAYSFPVKAGRGVVWAMSVTVPPFTRDGEDCRQRITVFDFHFKMSRPFCLYRSIAPRAFVERDGTEVTNIFQRVTAAPAEDTKALPVAGWGPLNPEKDKGVTTEVVRLDVGGEMRDCLQITWTKAEREKQRYACVKVPFSVNALEWNTFSFLYKIETPDGLETCEGRELSPIPQYFMFDKYIDNPGISFASTEDCYDYNASGVTRQHLSQGRREVAGLPAGWRFFASDLVNDDPTGNKWFSMDKITSYEITLKNSLLKEGQKVVFTIALPRLTRGLVYRGGDMALYKEFLSRREAYSPRPYEEALKAEPFGKAVLAKPIPVLNDRIANIQIIQTREGCVNMVGRTYAAEFLRSELLRALNPLNDIPVIVNGEGDTNGTCRLFLGIPRKAPREVTDAVAAFRKECRKTPATFVMEHDGDFYFAGASDFETVGQEKGIMNGVLDFLEGNLGIMWPRFVKEGENPTYRSIRPDELLEDYSFTWGSRWVVRPAMQWWGVLNWDERLSYFNRASYGGCWYGEAAIEMSCYRAWAANHNFGFGGGKEENGKWGLGASGKRYRPGCYSGTPCLINVLEDGKTDFFSKYLRSMYRGKTEPFYQRYSDNAAPCWIEDTWNTCQCPECLKPFRLPDGTLITKDDPDFKTEAHAVNAMAYNQMVRVYLNRSMKVHYLVYFYTLPVPRTPVSQYIQAHFCPYVRCSYNLPLYAPCHDKFWRVIAQWAQVSPTMGVSDYFLGANFRPGADVQALELKALRELGVKWYGQETERKEGSVPESWVAARKLYMPDADTDALRAYYCSKVFGRGAEQMYDFYAKLRSVYYDQVASPEFEETGWSELGRAAIATPSARRGCANLAEELDKLIESASKRTRSDPRAHWYVENIRSFWDWYYTNAKKPMRK